MDKPDTQPPVSALRLRLGALMFILWWIPIWLIAPFISEILGVGTVKSVTVVTAIVQTIIGLAGLVLAGKQVIIIMRDTNKRALPKLVLRVIITGKLDK